MKDFKINGTTTGRFKGNVSHKSADPQTETKNYIMTIFQVKKENTRQYGFMGWGERKKVLKTEVVNLLDIYQATYYRKTSKKPDLEKIFYEFNMERPKDFESYSLSTGDIVRITDIEGNQHYYYCDFAGWKDITKYIR
jgi:hypothetical protein